MPSKSYGVPSGRPYGNHPSKYKDKALDRKPAPLPPDYERRRTVKRLVNAIKRYTYSLDHGAIAKNPAKARATRDRLEARISELQVLLGKVGGMEAMRELR